MNKEYGIDKMFPEYNFLVTGVSYVGNPKSNTVMYVTKKVERLVDNLRNKCVKNCLIFAEKGIAVDEDLLDNNHFVFSSNPVGEYAEFLNKFVAEQKRIECSKKYLLTEGGYYLGEDVQIGNGCYIEPNCLIGHGVTIGDSASILSGTVIKNSNIGNNFIANENSVIGAYGFTMATDSGGNKIRIPTLGAVIIGDNVEVGSHNNISCGSSGNTIISDNVKIDTQVHIGHDVQLKNNVEITAGCIVGGFAIIGENAFLGINSTIRNRIVLGKNSRVSMGAVVTKDVEDNQTVTGNFAVDHNRFISELKQANDLSNPKIWIQ